jgi:hypothetical protein
MKTIFQKAFLLALFAGISLVQARGFAQEEEPEKEDERTWEQTFIDSNIAISKWFDSVAEGLDLFLVGRRVTNRVNDSHIRIENLMISQEGRALSNSVSVGVNPRFPNLEEYWHLKFATYDERADRRNAQADYLRQTPREKNYGATVGVFKKLGSIRTAFEPRIELKNPLSVSHSLSFESVATMKSYQINPKLEFWATPDKGVGTFQALNFNLHLNKIWSITWINQGDYQEKTHLYSVTNGFSLGQILNKKSAVSYNLFFGSNNQPNYHLESYNFGVAYSQVLYRKILDFQVTPNVDFQRTLDFKRVLGITFSINLNF